ncbi:arylesterase [Acinetobacter sp.]|uniref:arylesterase n=1 Tax=Acinetobacter sp. TaxID=472 RepID=UPI0026481990|nr:arylesterase [Acinetobacter sp.]MDN5513258.1 arylesterase [Acinetobacter sp.]MDN5524814.1 arylesterase [Acinetobacter sp.]
MQNRNLKTFVFACLAMLGLGVTPIIASAKTIMIVGDSISAGYGIQAQQGWVSLLQKRLDQQYPKQHKVVNASVSGETTSGAVARLPKLLQTYKPHIVVIEVGGNDGLRGQPPLLIQKNLATLVQHSLKANAKVIVLGMKIPPNYGTAYSKAFEKNYKIVSQQHHVPLLPFFLEGVAGKKSLMQADLVHPTAQAQSILLNNVYPYIKGAL